MASRAEILPRSNASRWTLAIYAACFTAATFNHGRDIARGGLLPYTFAPAPLNLFWTTLVALDPAVIAGSIPFLWQQPTLTDTGS